MNKIDGEFIELSQELKREFLNLKLAQMAQRCVLKQEGWGKRYIKGARKGKKRKLYKLDPVVLKQILGVLKPYICKSVYNSTGMFDQDLIAYIESEIWRVLREEGATNFVNLAKLRILNSVTYKFNQRTWTKNRNINVTAVSYYTPIGLAEGDEVQLLDTLRDTEYGQTEEESNLALLTDDERYVLDYLRHADASDKPRHQSHYQKFIRENKNLIVSAYSKL